MAAVAGEPDADRPRWSAGMQAGVAAVAATLLVQLFAMVWWVDGVLAAATTAPVRGSLFGFPGSAVAYLPEGRGIAQSRWHRGGRACSSASSSSSSWPAPGGHCAGRGSPALRVPPDRRWDGDAARVPGRRLVRRSASPAHPAASGAVAATVSATCTRSTAPCRTRYPARPARARPGGA